jgi:hypothetical protein
VRIQMCLCVYVGMYVCMFIYMYVRMCVKVKIKFTLEQATKAQRASRGIAQLFL